MSTANELSLIPEIENPAELFRPGGLDPILAAIEAKVHEVELDISTERGRREVASLARKIASSKTYIDDAGKFLVAEWKAQAKAVDQERAKARDFLDRLKDEIRAPLTEFEERDQRRIEAHEAALASLDEYHAESRDYTVESAQAMLVKVAELRQRDWEEFAQRAKNVLRNCEHFATIGLDLARKREAEAAELARLRKETAERDQRERDERIAREAAERARIAAEDKARREAAEAASLAAEAEERAAWALHAAEERAKKAEEKAKAEIRRMEQSIIAESARIEAERVAEENEARARAEDERIRKDTREESVEAMCRILDMFPGANDVVPIDIARLIFDAIDEGVVPHITINY